MFNNDGSFNGTVSNAVNTHSGSGQVLKELEKDSKFLYDVADLVKIFNVTSRTLFNWQARNELPLIKVGGKLYLSRDKLVEMILRKEGGLQ